MGAKMELMKFSAAITKSHRFERGVFKTFQSGCLGHLSVEASAAQLAVSFFG
jgi:hypothetical protein